MTLVSHPPPPPAEPTRRPVRGRRRGHTGAFICAIAFIGSAWVLFCPRFAAAKRQLLDLLQQGGHKRFEVLGLLAAIAVLLVLQAYGRLLERVLGRLLLRWTWLPRIPRFMHNTLWAASAGIALAAFSHDPSVVVLETLVILGKLVLHTPLGVGFLLAVPLIWHAMKKQGRVLRQHPMRTIVVWSIGVSTVVAAWR